MTAPAYIPDAGDLIWTDFDPTLGREQAGRRPALVVSPAAFTENTGFAIVCPITSRVRPFPTSVVLPGGLPVAGEILDEPHSQRRYAGSACALCRCDCGTGDRAAGARQARYGDYDLRPAVLLRVWLGLRFRDGLTIRFTPYGRTPIRRDDQPRLHQALGDQHPVEGIAMMQRQTSRRAERVQCRHPRRRGCA